MRDIIIFILGAVSGVLILVCFACCDVAKMADEQSEEYWGKHE